MSDVDIEMYVQRGAEISAHPGRNSESTWIAVKFGSVSIYLMDLEQGDQLRDAVTEALAQARAKSWRAVTSQPEGEQP